MFRRFLMSGSILCGVAGLSCSQLMGAQPPVAPLTIQPTTAPATAYYTAPSPTAVRNPARPPIIIKGRIGQTVMTDRSRIGVTHHASTRQFVTTPMARQMDGSLPHHRKFGDGTVIAGPERLGITHAGKTFPYGAEVGTRRTGWANTGLTTLHTPGRVWSGFRRAP